MNTREPLRVAVLVSGTGTNLQALIDTVHGHEAQIVGVASSAPGARALERAASAGIETAVFERVAHESRQARDAALGQWLREREVELIVLAGYMELLSADFVRAFAGAIINVHPSLLPAFPGLRAIEQALEYGVRVFGVTVHFVDEGTDSGPVILQEPLALADPGTAAEVLGALRPLEHRLLPDAVRLIARGRLSPDPANPRRIRIAPAP